MAKLATIGKLRDAIAKDSYGDLNMVLNAALEAVTPAIEGVLTTTFTRSAARAAFYSLSDADVGPGGLVTLHLPQAFASSGTVQVYTAYEFGLLSEADAASPANLVVDPTRGYVTLLPEATPNGLTGWVKVEATYGFDFVADILGFVYTGVPGWLEQAAMHAALEVFDVLRQTNDTETARKELRLPAISLQTLAMYRRTKQPVVYPV